MKFFLAKNCLINFSDAFPRGHGKQAEFQVNNVYEFDLSFDEYSNDFIEALTDMIQGYKRLNYGGAVILKDLKQAMCQGSLQLLLQGAPLRHWIAICGRNHVGATVTLANIDGGNYTISTKGMPGMPTCEDIEVNFPSESLFKMFSSGSTRISALLTVEVEVTSAKPKPCNKITEKVLEDEIHSDVVIIAKDGGHVKCHKSFLSACSSVFAAMFQTDMKESKTHQIEMPDMTEEGVRAFLKYIYFLGDEEPHKSSEIAFELLVAAHKYDVTPDLETAMKELLLSKPLEWYNVDVAVNLFQFAGKIPSGDALKVKAVKVLKKHHASLKQQQSVQEMFRKYPEVAIELCVAFASNL